ncbi:MAG: hypothetical protein Q7U75_17365 [Desulfobacterales bacterium]|jgi:hypothetical protein|nr:hypothetical protein [Desulfobacterales bacterium]
MTLREVQGLNQPTAEKAVCVHRPAHAAKQPEAAYQDLRHAEMPTRSGKWKKWLKNWITPPT